ncbi:lipase family protein [Nocardia sp. CDC159]|uniref:Lipase family protein n=1 Tax=Nocardia pulmonis TaxID=2951408 RepID=A0A9X2IVZ7_9NOCA|nr:MULTISPECIES: lipase family protein [Nocardia]MCM6774412.1 lipase family protein [Nocardia pulmonis]MCM6787522.1 lipase family protein [Nocardia sp. CDC159]
MTDNSQITDHGEFYREVLIGPGRRPGDLLRLRKSPAPQLRGTEAWQIVYVSSDSYDELIAVSGTILVPDTNAEIGPGPILVYCPGFHGLTGSCAPSRLLAAGEELEADRIGAALDRGWTVAVPDGQGYLDDGPHTFLASRAAAHCALDIARATHRLPDVDTDDGPILVWGYGDGGRTAASAGELCDIYAPELDVRGVAAGAVVADPGELVTHLASGRWAGLGLAGLGGLSHAYRHLPLRHLLTDEGHDALADAETIDVATLLARYPMPLSHWCERPDPWNDPMWRYVLERERLGWIGPRTRIHLLHGTNDAVVPIAQGLRLCRDYEALGTPVTWREYGAGHLGAASAALAEALARLADDLQHNTASPTIVDRHSNASDQ